MAVRGPPVNSPPLSANINPPSGTRAAIRASRGPKVGGSRRAAADHPPEEHDQLDLIAIQSLLAARIRRLNSVAPAEWTADDHHQLERLAAELLEGTEQEADLKDPGNPYARQIAGNAARRQLRAFLQTLQPPPALAEAFAVLFDRLRPVDLHDASSFARQTLMNSKVRQDVLNRQMEEAVDEASLIASRRRVEAISRDGGRRNGGDSHRHDSDTPSQGSPPLAAPTLRHTLRTLKKRRDLSRTDAEAVATIAFETMRALREEVAPRWAPETQPWLLTTADRHIFQSVLAVIPESLLRETAVYEGMQRLRAGEHAYGVRANDALAEALKRI